MSVITDIFVLSDMPAAGETVGTAGSGADVILDPAERTADVPFSTSSTEPDPAIFSTSAQDFSYEGGTYATTALYGITFDMGGTLYDGFILEFEDTVTSAIDYVFMPDASAGDLTLTTFTITSMTAITGVFLSDVNVACFAAGTRIATPGGPCRIEDLSIGQPIVTLDHGPLPLVGIESSIAARASARPVVIPSGALGVGVPARRLVVSRQHRVLITALPGGACLVPAKDLVGLNGVSQQFAAGRIRLFHLHFDRHATVFAEGLPCESRFSDGQIAWPERRGQALRRELGQIVARGDALVGPDRADPKAGTIRGTDQYPYTARRAI